MRKLVIQHSGNIVGHINEVTVRRAQLNVKQVAQLPQRDRASP